MVLDNFILEEYNNHDFEHKKLVSKLNNDASVYRFLGIIEMYINNCLKQGEINGIDTFYVAKYNNEVIGFIALNVIEDKFEISYAILPEYRKEYLASLLLQEFSEAIFSQYNYVDKIYLQINQQNIGSIKTATLVGFEKEKSTRYSMKR